LKLRRIRRHGHIGKAVGYLPIKTGLPTVISSSNPGLSKDATPPTAMSFGPDFVGFHEQIFRSSAFNKL
jgi:hypothetical protein